MNTRKIVVWTRTARSADAPASHHVFRIVDACGCAVAHTPVRWAFRLG